MDTLGFPLQGWHLLTASWTEHNVSLDATAWPATSPHLRCVLHLDWVGIASGTLSMFMLYFSGLWHSYTDRLPVLVQSLPLWHTGRWWITTCNLFHSSPICKVIEWYFISFPTVMIVTHIITKSCSRRQRNNDWIGYNFQHFCKAVPFWPLETQE